MQYFRNTTPTFSEKGHSPSQDPTPGPHHTPTLKNYFRSTINEARLNGLSHIYIDPLMWGGEHPLWRRRHPLLTPHIPRRLRHLDPQIYEFLDTPLDSFVY